MVARIGLTGASCGGPTNPCAGIDPFSTSHFSVNTTVKVQNANDDRKLVAFAVLHNGIEVATSEL